MDLGILSYEQKKLKEDVCFYYSPFRRHRADLIARLAVLLRLCVEWQRGLCRRGDPNTAMPDKTQEAGGAGGAGLAVSRRGDGVLTRQGRSSIMAEER